jgi:hypothetical protein
MYILLWDDNRVGGFPIIWQMFRHIIDYDPIISSLIRADQCMFKSPDLLQMVYLVELADYF